MFTSHLACASSNGPFLVRRFDTALGALTLYVGSQGLSLVSLGRPRLEKLRRLARPSQSRRAAETTDVDGDWLDALAARLKAYAAGEVDEFLDVPLDPSGLSPFRSAVTNACRHVPYGSVASYRDLARRVGRPGAARAVGRVMAMNPWPIIVPCHRVVAADGSLGGYSAPTGLSMKKRLLALERFAVHAGAARFTPVASDAVS